MGEQQAVEVEPEQRLEPVVEGSLDRRRVVAEQPVGDEAESRFATDQPVGEGEPAVADSRVEDEVVRADAAEYVRGQPRASSSPGS